MKISELIEEKYEKIGELRSRIKKITELYDKRIAALRERDKKIREKKRLEAEKKHLRRLKKASYVRVLYLQKLKEDRVAMEAYRKEKQYTCELCGTVGVDELPAGINFKVLHTNSAGSPVHILLDSGMKVTLKKYMMVHHAEDGRFQCLDRWCHDVMDSKLRAEGVNVKAIDKQAVMKKVEEALKVK